MQKHNHIKALFFLGIFSILLLHQAVPHIHHQYEVEHTHDSVAYNNNHSHHHEAPEKESPRKGFLDLFLEMHVHSVVSNEILLTRESIVKNLDVKEDIIKSVSFVHYSISINYDEVEKIRVYHPPNNYFDYYLSSLDSRGPPSLG